TLYPVGYHHAFAVDYRPPSTMRVLCDALQSHKAPSIKVRCISFVVPSIMRQTSSGLSTVGSFRGVLGNGRSSKCMLRRLSTFLQKKRKADIRISTVPGLSFLSCSRYH